MKNRGYYVDIVQFPHWITYSIGILGLPKNSLILQQIYE